MKTIFLYQWNATDSYNRMILHFMDHFTDTINAIMTMWNIWSWLSIDIGTPPLAEKQFLYYNISCNISGKSDKYYPLIFIYHCCMISDNDIHNLIWKKRYGFYLNFKIHFIGDWNEIMPQNFVMILWVIHSL